MDTLHNNRAYLGQVEKTINQLRAACLGQDIPLTAILPEQFKDKSPEEQTEQITDQLLFALTAVAKEAGSSLNELPECRGWIRDATLYLMTVCCEEDRTCYQLAHVVSLPKGIRVLMFGPFKQACCHHELTEGEPPRLLKELDAAWLCLLEVKEQLESSKAVYTELKAFQNNLLNRT